MEKNLQREDSGANPVNPHDLIRIARQLASGAAGGNRGRPRQAELRRAVSSAYYALFHALAHCCANRLAGSGRGGAAWIQTYRALEHGHARNQCNDQSAMGAFPAEIQAFGRRFVFMQRQRQQADYSPSVTYSRRWVIQAVDETENIITALENAPSSHRRAFALHVLLRRHRE